MGELKKKRHYEFFKVNSDDIFSKCNQFTEMLSELDDNYSLSNLFSAEVHSSLDRKVQVCLKNEGLTDLLFFDSNGYLGLQNHDLVREAMHKAVDIYGSGTPSVTLLGGMSGPLKALEKTVARLHKREDAIIFSSAYAANIGLLTGLIRSDDIILIDKNAHASLHDGAKMSRAKQVVRYQSGNLDDLRKKLTSIKISNPKSGLMIVTDSVFSMEGRVANLPELKKLSTLFGAKLFLDECHSIGVIGESGGGIEDYYNMHGSVDLLCGCFSKAFGHYGGYITGPKEVIQYLRFFSHPWIFSTALSASSAYTINEAIKVFLNEKEHLENLQSNTKYFQDKLRKNNIVDVNGPSPIIGVPIGPMERLLDVATDLIKNGIKVGHVGYPAVDREKSILRIVPTARHTKDDLDFATKILKKVLSNH